MCANGCDHVLKPLVMRTSNGCGPREWHGCNAVSWFLNSCMRVQFDIIVRWSVRSNSPPRWCVVLVVAHVRDKGATTAPRSKRVPLDPRVSCTSLANVIDNGFVSHPAQRQLAGSVSPCAMHVLMSWIPDPGQGDL